ncbi:MAG: hypothetical protein RL757_711 [Bacteroidota bacterium]|jgi:predicted RND superfamily exporter protein
MDKFESFLKENSEAFNLNSPNPMVWAAIEQQLDERDQNNKKKIANNATTLTAQPSRMRAWVVRTAAAAAILVLGIGLGKTLLKDKLPVLSSNSDTTVVKSLDEAEDFYGKKVQYKINQLASFNPDPSVMEDLKQIDEVQTELRRELESAPESSREEIIQTMIKNYKIKLDILERVLQHVQEYKNENGENPTAKPRRHDTII